MSKYVKLTILILLTIIFILHPKCDTLVGQHCNNFLYNIFHFITYQALGIVHEGGHGVCYILHTPQVVTAANGTIFQLLFPYGVYWYYKRKQEYFGSYIALFFLGLSLHYTAWYIASASSNMFISAEHSFLGSPGIHDFSYLLKYFGILKYKDTISSISHFVAYIFMLYALIRMIFNYLDKD